MRRLVLLSLLLGLLCPVFVAGAQPSASTSHDRYGISFYGIDLPAEGANLLLIIDASKSMNRKDAARVTPGRRWETLIDEVRTMGEQMYTATRTHGVPFSVSILFEGGSEAHKGVGPFDMGKPSEQKQLLELLERKELLSGGNFETTFRETLWPFVARHAITCIIYLGDNDIGAYADCVQEAVSDWYAAGETASTPHARKCRQLKAAWRKTWARWRPKSRTMPSFKQTRQLPPPPKEIVFSCVAIGQSSSLLQTLATLGKGQYIERKAKSRRKRSQ